MFTSDGVRYSTKFINICEIQN